jgi:hypothetical protein
VPTTGEVVSLARPDREQPLGAAAAAFLTQPSLASTTRRSYQQTLDLLAHKTDQRPRLFRREVRYQRPHVPRPIREVCPVTGDELGQLPQPPFPPSSTQP